MYHLVVTYQTPTDREAFDKYYFETHVPLVKAMPNLVSFFTLRGEASEPGVEPAWYLQAHLAFESKEIALASLASEEGKASGDDVGNFETTGVTVVMSEKTEL